MEEITVWFGRMRQGEEKAVSDLVWSVFEEYEAKDYSPQGIAEFRSFIEPELLRRRFAQDGFFLLCCKEGEQLAGVLAVRDFSHISLLFVAKEFQRRGIARRLLELAIEQCRSLDGSLDALTVNSSRYAVGIYEKLGFEKTSPELEKNGIRHTPMRLKIYRAA
jgi:ribosomal protein S18 acetylase RimI-like enzyme